MPNEQRYHINIIFPRIVSTLEYTPPLDSFRSLVRKVFKFSLHKRKIIVKTFFFILKIQERIVFVENIRGNTVCIFARYLLWAYLLS